ncbi:2-oxoacid:acceptor oxidoreductase family protein [Dethiobacter alkaliphilus]|uniref:2-oxoacid:acceptor oxidoreductase family protein n=1 Tax=Dethiobacter alkaliphilus TaxID=427926 RepID=UPI0022277F27|nr:2-oxoacid:acceptor oxidoreductase family protein [Dethiobacter alkaliphilus]MCW3489084.1 2-oxoacid:acceptor oxidoreductase family protein [Dethiobacter alkaliphilus]
MARLVKIAIAGEGGQGVQAIGDILAEAGNEEGKEALYIPNFGIEQRGGVSVAFVQISEEQIGSPKFKHGDIVIALSERAVARTMQYVTKDTLFVYDSSLIAPPEVDDEAVGLQTYDTVAPEAMADSGSEQPKSGQVELPQHAKQVVGIPATDIAQQELHPRVFNMIILGATVRAAGTDVVDIETIKKALESKLGKKFEDNPKLRELNYNALQKGIELVEKALQEEGK